MRPSLAPALTAVLLLLLLLTVTVCSSAGLRRRPTSPSSSPASSAIIFPSGRRTTRAPVGGCYDYAGRWGRCVTLSMCPALRVMLAADGPTRRTASRLRVGNCGSWRGGPLVCCGRGAPVSTEPPPTSPPPPPPPPPELHPNRAILERGRECGFGFHSNIFGGGVTALGELPWVAALAYTLPGLDLPEVNCGGALIGLQYVLTAAHCVTNLPDQFQLHSVRLGEHDLGSDPDCSGDVPPICLPPAQVFSVAETIIHPDYNDPVRDQHDIALIRLDRPAVENNGVRKLCLPLGAARLADPTGSYAIAAGFGLTETRYSSDVMLSVRLPVVPQKNCTREIEPRGRRIGPGQLCAGGEVGLDSCVGDSGGPLIIASPYGPPYHVIGVTSFGPQTCGLGGVPGVYTRVTEYLGWILDHVRE